MISKSRTEYLNAFYLNMKKKLHINQWFLALWLIAFYILKNKSRLVMFIT